ncbi:CatB-related O-acetyltransferase [Microbacterium sp. ARD31]|uniref:CatB-related O-acetyltransferase n=1 Tax=Microbacterium sp. ARD31 TaxID=2962576 RepID=UPI00288214CF|nr:CatB-related O-acetyltransferase [Microbacterium sp. ARD31]MDT0183422.1 CatB-related O-acetyltransferase [Microbacterium sp. ARD31]
MARLRRFVEANTTAPRPTLQQQYPEHRIGRGCYGPLQIKSFGAEGERVTIGNFCSFAEETAILVGADHRHDWVTTYPFTVFNPRAAHIPGHPAPSRGVTIGNDVWMGFRSMVLDGVTVGDGAVIAAGAVVTRDVRPFAIVAGCPAREVARRFTDESVERLLEIAWWNWSDDRIEKSLEMLLSDDIVAFTTGSSPIAGDPPDVTTG